MSLRKSKSNPITWHLIQIFRNGVPSRSRQYCIISSRHLIAGQPVLNQTLGRVRFYRNSVPTEGRLIFSSKNRGVVSKKLHELASEYAFLNFFLTVDKLYLVQFSKGDKDIVHAVVPQKHISWLEGYPPFYQKIMVNDGKTRRLAFLLGYSENKKHVYSEFQKLKQYSFEYTYDPKDKKHAIDDDEWILVMYTCSKANMVYTIMNNRDTLFKDINTKKDAVAYTTDGQDVYKMIIIRRSHSLFLLMQFLTHLKIQCPRLSFPLNVNVECPHAIPPPGFVSKCGTLDEYESFMNSHILDRQLPELSQQENTMKQEASIFMKIFNIVETAKKNIIREKKSID